MGEVFPFAGRHRHTRGTVHVMPCTEGGYEISHESESGSSWGAVFGPYATAMEAIIRAHCMNAREYDGICHVEVHPSAVADAYPSVDQQACRPSPFDGEVEF